MPLLLLKVRVFHPRRCFCPPTCTNTQYVATHSLASFPNKASRVMQQIRQEPSFQNYDERDLSLLHVYFKDKSIVQFNKDVIYTVEDLIAAFGGLVGLCTGLSLLSIAEFVYFFTLRWGLQLCREKKYNKNMSIGFWLQKQPNKS